MVVMFEVAPPFRLRPKVERFGPLVRVIWGWFSVSHVAAGVNDMAQAFRFDEREKCELLAESATAYTQFQTVEHYKIAAAIAAGIRTRSNVEVQRDSGSIIAGGSAGTTGSTTLEETCKDE